MKICHLKIPLSEEAIHPLKIGDAVTLTGTLWTCGSRFHIRVVEERMAPPVDTNACNVMLHSEPIVEYQEGSWRLRAGSITASSRFEKWEPEAIERLGLRAIVGKGKVGDETLKAMERFGCIHLIRSGLFPGAYATLIEKIREVFWLELGLPEALWVMEVKDFGPLIVEADIRGESLYRNLGQKIDERIPDIHKKLAIEDVVYHKI